MDAKTQAAGLALLHAGYGQLTQAREYETFAAIADFYGVQQRLVVQLIIFEPLAARR